MRDQELRVAPPIMVEDCVEKTEYRPSRKELLGWHQINIKFLSIGQRYGMKDLQKKKNYNN